MQEVELANWTWGQICLLGTHTCPLDIQVHTFVGAHRVVELHNVAATLPLVGIVVFLIMESLDLFGYPEGFPGTT